MVASDIEIEWIQTALVVVQNRRCSSVLRRMSSNCCLYCIPVSMTAARVCHLNSPAGRSIRHMYHHETLSTTQHSPSLCTVPPQPTSENVHVSTMIEEVEHCCRCVAHRWYTVGRWCTVGSLCFVQLNTVLKQQRENIQSVVVVEHVSR